MNILVLGGGGREHALAWAIAQNPKCDRLIVAPGNPGIAEIAEVAAVDPTDPVAVLELVREVEADFVVIGPEAPLAAGVSDALMAAGVLVFGPSAAAARLEASKAFTKEVCDAVGAPTAAWARFDNLEDARTHIAQLGTPIVVKADGLAAGKGVVIPSNPDEALAAVERMLGGAHGEAGHTVVIEEFMGGEEASLFVLVDGAQVLPLGTAQDHKRIGDGDTGPNTGGMGAYSPAPILTPARERLALDTIIRPTMAEMVRRGTPYRGVLYAGLMIDGDRVRLVEYNARFGDPECQALMLRLGAQVLDLMLACAEGRLMDVRPVWADDHALCVVLAARGYPGQPVTGGVIGGLDGMPADSWRQVFHAGTMRDEGGVLRAAGGRVLNATARGRTLQEARDRAYEMADRVLWADAYMRRDIGWRALPADAKG